MKIVYFGTDVFLKVFQYLLNQHEILALYTYHNEEDYFTEREIVRLAHRNGIPVHYDRITQEQMRTYVIDAECGLFFSAEYDSRIPVPVDLPSLRAVNVHSALLPEGRSYYPIETAMAAQRSVGGVTVHKLASAFDRGDILAQRSFSIEPQDDSIDIYLKSAAAACSLVKEIMGDLEGYWQHARVQTIVLPSWKLSPETERSITHQMTVAQAGELYRCFNKLTIVCVDSMAFYVDGFMPGNARIGNTDRDIIPISDRRIIYGLADGNVRIDIEPMRSSRQQ